MEDTPTPLLPNEHSASEEKTNTPLSEENTNVPPSSTTTKSTVVAQKEYTIPILKEQLHVEKDSVRTGMVVVHKEVVSKEVTVDTSYNTQEVVVNRVEVGRYLEDDEPLPTTRVEGETTIIPVLKEVEEVIVRRRRVLVEEIHLVQKTTKHNQEQQVLLKEHQVHIEHQKEDNTPPSA